MRVFVSVFMVLLLMVGGVFCVSAAEPDPVDSGLDGDPADTGNGWDAYLDPVEGESGDSTSDPVEAPEVVEDVLSGEGDEGGLDGDSVSGEEFAENDSLGDDSGSDGQPLSDLSVSELTVNAEAVTLSVPAPEDNIYPAGAPLMGGVYMQVDTVQLGEVLLYVPTEDQFRSFSKTVDGNPVNITGSTITGYCWDGNDYTVRWASFGQAQYRPVDYTSSGYSDLTITDVIASNIVFIESNEDLPVVPDDSMLVLLVIFLLGGILLCLFMKRL